MSDLIRRSELLSVFKRWERVPDYNEAERNIIKAAIYEAENIPAVDAVEVRHGRWEDVEIVDEDIVAENHMMIASMFCPVCKRYASTVYHYGNPLYMMNYCNNCGARMDGEDGDA